MGFLKTDRLSVADQGEATNCYQLLPLFFVWGFVLDEKIIGMRVNFHGFLFGIVFSDRIFINFVEKRFGCLNRISCFERDGTDPDF